MCLIIDKNYDDRFDFNEFADLYPGASEEFFKKLDLNKDEFLSKQELKEYYRKDDKSLNIERVTEDYAMLEEQIVISQLNNFLFFREKKFKIMRSFLNFCRKFCFFIKTI